MRMSMCACVVRVAGRVQLHVRACMCDARWHVHLGTCECGRADVEVWLWACASSLTWIKTRLLRSLGGGGGHTWPEGCGSALPVWCPDRRLSFCQFPFLSLMLSPKVKPCPEPNPVVVQFRVHMSHLVASCWWSSHSISPL